MNPTPTSGERPQDLITCPRCDLQFQPDRPAPTPDAEALAKHVALELGLEVSTLKEPIRPSEVAAILLPTIARLVAERDEANSMEHANKVLSRIARERDEGLSIVGGYGVLLARTQKMTKDLKEITAALDMPETDLTLTLAECVTKMRTDLTTARAETRDWIKWHGQLQEKLQEANARIASLEKAADGMAEALNKTLSQLQAVIVAVSLGTYTNRKELMAENVITEGNSTLTAYRAARRNQEPSP